jgi:hypothetical protein
MGHLPPDFTSTTTPVLAPLSPAALSPEPPICSDPDPAFAVTPVDSGLGHRAQIINGYPDLRVLDADKKPLDVHLKRGPSLGGRTQTPSH